MVYESRRSLVFSLLMKFSSSIYISFRPLNFRPDQYLVAMSKVKSKIRKAKGREEEEEDTGAAANNLEEGKDLLCCLPQGQGAVQYNDDVL